jgi:hypothetical protein
MGLFMTSLELSINSLMDKQEDCGLTPREARRLAQLQERWLDENPCEGGYRNHNLSCFVD